MQTTPMAAIVQAVAFAADKHRNQRYKDNATTAAELRAMFGEQVASVELAVTDDKALTKERRSK